MDSNFLGPVNIGSEEMVTINQLVDTTAKVAGKIIEKKHVEGPLGVRGRNSNNDLVREKLGWDYSQTLEEGITKTYKWISSQISGNGSIIIGTGDLDENMITLNFHEYDMQQRE